MDYKEYYKEKKVLVTGGAGAIGSRLTRALLEIGAVVIVLDDLSSAYMWNLPSSNNLLFVKGDVANDIDVKRVFNENPTVVFHALAQYSLEYIEAEDVI